MSRARGTYRHQISVPVRKPGHSQRILVGGDSGAGRGATFGGIEAIAESDDTHPLRFEHPVDLSKHLLRLLKILDANAT